MSNKIPISEELRTHLTPLSKLNNYEVKDWTEWLTRPLVKVGKSIVFAAHNARYSTHVAGIQESAMGDDHESPISGSSPVSRPGSAAWPVTTARSLMSTSRGTSRGPLGGCSHSWSVHSSVSCSSAVIS